MGFFSSLLYYLSVPKCVGCGTWLKKDDGALCKNCMTVYSEHKEGACSRCAKKLSLCSCPPSYTDTHFVHTLIKCYRYKKGDLSAPYNRLIYSLKREHRRDVVTFLAKELAESVRAQVKNPEALVVTSVPRRKDAVLTVGYDHAEALAKQTAKLLGAPYLSLLCSKGKKAQKETVGEERYRNAVFDYASGRETDLSGTRVLLVDDVVTTGASMGNCAMLLHGLGAKQIIGAAVAIAYPDKH